MKTTPLILLALLALTPMNHAADPLPITPSDELQQLLDQAVHESIAEFAEANLKESELASTLIDLRDPAHPRQASFRGGERIYPASVVKLFYLEAAHRWMEDGKIEDTPELRRAMSDMIVLSYNEATHYVVDLLTGTTSGPELPPDEMREWEHRRNAVNRYFAARGFENINVNQKPWCEGPYGREIAFIRPDRSNRNGLTTGATARLLAEIALGRAITPERSRQMLELMRRDPFAPGGGDSQTRDFTGPAIPQDAKLWSKAGWTSETRHDAALIELPGGRRIILVTFTLNHAQETAIIPALARKVIAALNK